MLCKIPLGILSLLYFSVYNSTCTPLALESEALGKYPQCGDKLEAFDQECCEQGQKLLEEDAEQWEKRGFDISRQISLVWKTGSKSGSKSKVQSKSKSKSSECTVITDEVKIVYQRDCFERSARECCRNELNPNGLSRCRLVQRRKADGSILKECQKAQFSEHEGRFGVVRTVQPRCKLP